MIDLNSPENHELSWRRKLALLDVFCNPNPGAVCVQRSDLSYLHVQNNIQSLAET